MDKKLLGRKINAARKEHGLTSERLSELCNIGATYLRQIESGAKMPSLPIFITICRELKVSPAYLLAELLPDVDDYGMEELNELCRKATPRQLKMILSIIHGVLDNLNEETINE